jgi:hypothetical protein
MDPNFPDVLRGKKDAASQWQKDAGSEFCSFSDKNQRTPIFSQFERTFEEDDKLDLR